MYSRSRTSRLDRRCDRPGRYHSIRNNRTAIDVRVLIGPRKIHMERVHDLGRKYVPFLEIEKMITRAVVFRPIRESGIGQQTVCCACAIAIGAIHNMAEEDGTLIRYLVINTA